MIIPGIFEKDIVEIESKIKQVEGFADLVQVDVADGRLVDGKTFTNISLLGEINTSVSLELHFMVENPLSYMLEEIKTVTRACSQVEAEDFARDFIGMSRNMGYKTGLSLNPDTPLTKIEPYLDLLDYVQFMTVVPGGQGRPFDYRVLEKIREFRKVRPVFPVQVDGGIDDETLPLVLNAGANSAVIGSALFKDKKVIDEYLKFKDKLT